MHPALQKLCDEARQMMAERPAEAPELIRQRVAALEYTHDRAFNGHRRTLAAMRRDGVASADLTLAITDLSAIARGEALSLESAE
jgi:hypothetical protein